MVILIAASMTNNYLKVGITVTIDTASHFQFTLLKADLEVAALQAAMRR